MEDGGWRCGFMPHSALRVPRFCEPGFQILLATFLRFQIFHYDHHRSSRENDSQQRGEERLGGRGDAGKRQRSATLHTPGEGLRGGSFQDVSEHAACR